jgi:hypothetical protein
MSTVTSHNLEPRFEIVQEETTSVSEIQQLKKRIVSLEQENAALQALLEEPEAQTDIWVGAPEPTMRHCLTASSVEFVPYFSITEFED